MQGKREMFNGMVMLIAALVMVGCSSKEESQDDAAAIAQLNGRGAFGFATPQYHHVDGCMVCHELDRPVSNLSSVREVIETPNSGARTVVFTALTGTNSYADGDASYDGVCEVCHTQNRYHLNDGSDGKAHFDGKQCTQCHLHTAEFAPPFRQAHNTHIHASKGPHLACSDCHAEPFVFGPTVFADGLEFQATRVCDDCHSPGGSYDGVNDPVLGAKANWAEGVYQEEMLPPGKEKWCAGCHDEAPSHIAGVDAPNVIGNEQGSTPYGTGWGFYRTGHGLPLNAVYPASGVNGAGKGCLDCHDAARAHVDGQARSYVPDSDYLSFDPVSASYQEGYRLKDVAGGYDGKYPLHIPRTGHVFPPGFRENAEFALCFSCHDESRLFNGGDPVSGEGAGTNFRNQIDGTWTSLHNLHTDGRNGPFGPTTMQYDSDFDGVADSRISCPACHNVHGSPSPAMLRHGELISTPGTADKVPALGFQYTPAGSYPLLADSSGGKTRFIGGGAGSVAKNGVCNMCHNDQASYTRLPIMGTPPAAPTNVSPAKAAETVSVTPLLVASPYVDPDPGESHRASHWQISATAGDYSAPAYDSGATADLTGHQLRVPLNPAGRYFWRVRYQNSAGAWSDFSAETTFSTAAGPGATLLLTPSGVFDAGAFSTSGAGWATALDGNDGDFSYVSLCCSGTGNGFYVAMDTPVGLDGAVIHGLTVHVYARYLDGPWPGAVPYAGDVQVGYRTGTDTRWETPVTTAVHGDYTLNSSQRFTTDSDGGVLELQDLGKLQVAVRRSASGSPELRVTAVQVQVEYGY